MSDNTQASIARMLLHDCESAVAYRQEGDWTPEQLLSAATAYAVLGVAEAMQARERPAVQRPARNRTAPRRIRDLRNARPINRREEA